MRGQIVLRCVKGGAIPLDKDLIKHRVLVRIGTSAPADEDAHHGGGKRVKGDVSEWP